MKDIQIVSVVGARPNIIKMAPLHKKLITHFDHKIIHTGQHYDYKMSEIFFKEFDLPAPDYNLDVGSGTANYQIGEMMMRLEKVYLNSPPDLVLVYGDTNSTLSGALSAKKCNLPLGHIESGLRSFDRRMPEETNRVITDHISDYLFTPTQAAQANLQNENIQGMVFQTGDISVEIVREATKLKSTILSELNIPRTGYLLFTVHREENTNSRENLTSIVNAVKALDCDFISIFPIHPRTKKILKETGLYEILESCKNLILIPPVGYLDFINLIKNAKKVVTDSGGVQKEAYLLQTPCITLRSNTEWVETVNQGWNHLTGTDTKTIVRNIMEWDPSSESQRPIFGRGNTSDEIIHRINELFVNRHS